MVAAGAIGKVRKVVVEYPQGWLATRLEESGQKQAAWRTDPKRSGAAGCIGDIGTHAENLAEYITGLQISELAADLTAFVKGRKLDDDGNVLLRFKGGAKGVLHSSQISVGEENNLNIRVYGEKGGLEWHQGA
jgi:predicted dehydrogenase